MNPVTGVVKRLKTMDEFLRLFQPDVWPQLVLQLQKPKAEGIMCFEVKQPGPHQGHRTAMIYGKRCKFKSLTLLAQMHMGLKPEEFQFPIAYFVKPKGFVGGAGLVSARR